MRRRPGGSPGAFESLGVGLAVTGAGAAAVLCTDVGRDRMRSGPNLEATARLAAKIAPCAVIASGGMARLEDIRERKPYGAAAKNALDMFIMLGNADALLSAVKFDSLGLVPVIAQDRATGVVRMLAWANAQALRATVENGLATFWSRSRNELWEKGKTSGNSMRVVDLRLDCDGDAVLYIVEANGPSCHTNATSCFFRSVTPGGLAADDGPAPIAAKV